MNLKESHDRLLAQDLKRHWTGLIVLYASAGVLAVVVGMTISERASLWLVGLGGFLLGMSVEKFATRQIRRVAKKLAQEQIEKLSRAPSKLKKIPESKRPRGFE
jgi:hypothetical protein